MRHNCTDCDTDTRSINEMYMVDGAIWRAHGSGDGMLCVGCLEVRMGRQLVPLDFTGAPINTDPEDERWRRSPRLRERLIA